MEIRDVDLTPDHGIIMLKIWRKEKGNCKRAQIIVYT